MRWFARLSMLFLALGCASTSGSGGGGGKSGEGEACTKTADCEEGLICTPNEAGVLLLCQVDPDTGGTGGTGDTGGGTGTDATDTDGTDTGGDTGGTGGGDINAGCDKSAPPGAICNPYCQKGCGENQMCTFGGGTFSCSAIGNKAIGEPCAGSQQCGLGLACFKLTGDPADTCHQFCVDDGDCPSGRKCDLNVNFSSGGEASFCGDVSVGCNAFDQTPCGDGEGCYLSNNATKCMAAGELQAGEVCGAAGPNSCVAGLQCLIVCTEICSIIEVNDDEPNCVDSCPVDFTAVNDENGIGTCVTSDPPAECDLYTQEGCPAGQGCYLTNEGWRCINAGAIEEGESCKFTNDCVPGTLCVNSRCQTACSLKEDADPAYKCDEVCAAFNQINPTIWEIGFCSASSTCDFWAQDCEDAGEACYVTGSGSVCMPPGAGGAEGAGCSAPSDCGAGMMCVSSTCTVVCSINEFQANAPICIDDCPSGEFEPVSVEAQIGRCI